jgi:hypothetical protein
MITARQVAAWIQSLPPDFQDAPFEAQVGSIPVTPKRLVAYVAKESGHRGVCVNPMGTHLPFDDSLKWEFVLKEP